MTLLDKLKNKVSKTKAFFGQKEWKRPTLKNDERNQLYGKIIHRDDEMVNGMSIKGDKWESEEGRYYPADAYYKQGPLEFLKTSQGQIQLKPGTKLFYEANARGTTGSYRRKAKLAPIHALNRVQQAERLQTLRDQNYTLDLSEYQAMLANPATNQQAVQELRFLQSLFTDAEKMDQRAIEEKMEKAQKASKILGFMGMALGAAAGVTSVGNIAAKAANVAQGSTLQATKLAEAVGDKLGKIESATAALGILGSLQGIKTKKNLNRAKMSQLNQNSAKLALKTAQDVAIKTASLVILGAAANLTIPGATITALAIVTTAAKGAVNVYTQRLEKKEMAIKMKKEELLTTIDEMIQNNGTIFYREDNPMFADAKVLKDKLDTLLNSVENGKVVEAIGSLEGANSAAASALLDDMMMNAMNPTSHTNLSYMKDPATLNAYKQKREALKKQYGVATNGDLDFELELQRLKNLEKMNNSNLQKLRARREKLRRLYAMYKEPKIQKNLENAQSSSITDPLPLNQSARKTRKLRR
jgi:hypothetical protein